VPGIEHLVEFVDLRIAGWSAFRMVRRAATDVVVDLQFYDPGDHKGRISIEPYFAVGIFSAQ
jgi:hypothetical protein